ncbi:lytic transglycosylase domain-containing protein [Rhizosaccharibacter radicis]
MTRHDHRRATMGVPHPADPPKRRGDVAARRVGGAMRAAAGIALMSLLAACAGNSQNGPAIPVAQEAAQYRAHARGHYAPPGPPDDPWGPYIDEASRRFDIPDTWIRAVMHQESGGHVFTSTGTLTTSPVGAMGLMQLMPPTYDDMRSQYSLGDDAYEPHDNIMAGTAYLRQMYDIYGSPGFLAAYNTGPGRLDDFLTRNRPLPRETRQYVAAIGPKIAGISPTRRSPADLMVAAHQTGVQYAAVQSTAETRSVRDAWANRRRRTADQDQPVEVAEAPAATGPGAATPAYATAWNSLQPAAPAATLAASTGGADNVRAAWANRATAAPAAAPVVARPVAVASAAAPGWSPAPTPASGPGSRSAPAFPVASAAPAFPVARAAAVPATMAAITPASTSIDNDPADAAGAAATPAAAGRRRFRLIRSAMAEPAPLLRDAGRGGAEPRDWAIQVGAFNSAAQANQAAGNAQSRSNLLSHARAEIDGVKQGRAKLFRARLTGLSRGAALQACEKISRSRGDCMVVSPDARS